MNWYREETSDGSIGKVSIKRIMGVTVGLLAASGSVLSGLHWYEISSDIINPMWYYSGAMLGVSVLKGIIKTG